jgi:two-component system, LuxR family, sensor kinase FixL
MLVKPIISFERAVGGTWAAAAPAWSARFAPPASRLLIGLIWLAAYVVLEWVSFIHDYKGLPVTPWNPGLGAVLALMILGGARYALVLFAGVLIAELVVLKSSLDWPVVLGIAAVISGGYGGVAAVARTNLRLDVGLNRLRDVFGLLAAGMAGAVIVALLLSLLLLATDQLDLSDVLVTVGPLLVGDAIGIAVMTPLVLRLALLRSPSALQKLWRLVPELALYVLVVIGALWISVGSQPATDFKFFYLLFVPVVLIAVRHGLDGACMGLAITQLGLVGLLHGYGYDANAFTAFQTMMLVLTATGLVVGVVVTERVHANRTIREVEERLRRKEAQAAQVSRINLVSGMASALAHEINQPMTAARALARSAQHLLRAPTADLARAEGNLTDMIAQIDHAAAVVRRMRDFLRRGRPHVSTIDVREMLQDALNLLRLDASARHVGVELDVPDELPPVHGDRVQLQQVVLNLARNAMEATAESGRADGHIRLFAHRAVRPNEMEIGVADNGPGIDASLAGRLFEPLTTSKEEGLGLGLSICASIVEAHGGRIWLQSHEAGATEFRFSLPLRQPEPTFQ